MSDKNSEFTPSTPHTKYRDALQAANSQKPGSLLKFPLRKGVMKPPPVPPKPNFNTPKNPPSTPKSGRSTTKSVTITTKGVSHTPKPSKRNKGYLEDVTDIMNRKRKLLTFDDLKDFQIPNKKLCRKLKRNYPQDDPLRLKTMGVNITNMKQQALEIMNGNTSPSLLTLECFLHRTNYVIIDYENLMEITMDFSKHQMRFQKLVEILLKGYDKQTSEVDKMRTELADYQDKLQHARQMLDREKKERRKVENERNCLEQQMVMARDLLFSDKCRNRLPEDTREKLAFFNNTSMRSHTSFDQIPAYPNRLNTINEVNTTDMNSTGSLLSDFSYSRSEDDLDVSLLQTGKKWKKYQPSPIAEEPMPVKNRRSSGNIVEIGVNEKIVATTTLSVSRDGPIHATSVIETIPMEPEKPREEEVTIPDIYVDAPTHPDLDKPLEVLYANAATDFMKRGHTFAHKSMIRPVTCGPCNKRISFGKIVLKCKDCRAVCHSECRDKLPLPCIPVVNTPNQKKMTGTIMDYVSSYSPMVPALLIHCVNEVELRGLSEVGLYRIPGSERDVKQLKERFLRGKGGAPLLIDVDIHVICGCIKDFLRSLQEPLIPTGLWKKFVSAVDNRLSDEIPPLLYSAIGLLPQPNRDTLAYMILHLQRVAQSPSCKMPIGNLAKVFGPTIVGYSSTESDPNMNLWVETRLQAVVMEQLLNLPTEYWSTVTNNKVEMTPKQRGLTPTPSTDSLIHRTSTKSLFTPLTGTRVRKPKRFFGTPPTK